MYIDKIYNKLFSDKNWDGIETLRAEVRSFTRGIEKYKDFYEPGYNLIKAYRNKAAQILSNKRNSPDYDPNKAFQYMRNAHNEAQQSDEIQNQAKQVARQAYHDKLHAYENSEFYDPSTETTENYKKWADDLGKFEQSYHDKLIKNEHERNGRGWKNRSQLKEFYGPAEFQGIYKGMQYIDNHDDPDIGDWHVNGGEADPAKLAYRWDKRKEREFKEDMDKAVEAKDAAMKKAQSDYDQSIPEPTAWNKITGKYGKAKKVAKEKYNNDVDSAWKTFKSAEEKAEKNKNNKSGANPWGR